MEFTGSLSSRLCTFVLPDGCDYRWKKLKVGSLDAMSTVSAPSDATVGDALNTMTAQHLEQLPIVDKAG